MVIFFPGATMMIWTSGTGKVAAVGKLETSQEGNLLPEDFPPDEKKEKWGKAVNGRHETVSFGYCFSRYLDCLLEFSRSFSYSS